MELIPLKRAYEVDEAINTSDRSRIVIVRFGRESKSHDKRINEVDDWLKSVTAPVNSSTNIKVYTVSMKAVPELVARYKLADPVTILFFRDNIQGGRLHGSDFTKQDVQDKVTTLADKKKKQSRRTEASINQNTSQSNDTTTNSNKSKETQPIDQLVSRVRNWWTKMNN